MTAANRYNPDKPRPSMLGGALLYLMPIPLLPASLMALMAGQTIKALAYGGGFTLAMIAATLIRRGIGIAREAQRRRIQRRSSTLPYKAAGAVVLSVGMFVVAWVGSGYSLMNSVLFALASWVGCYLYYGTDPLRRSPEGPAVGVTAEEVLELLDEGERRIQAIDAARRTIRNSEFSERLRRITTEARVILKIIEEDPRDARRARKFLKVYLEGAQQVTEGYARTHQEQSSPALEDNFRRVLSTIETVIADQQKKLRENNLSELDVQIEVLQMQLEKEGVT